MQIANLLYASLLRPLLTDWLSGRALRLTKANVTNIAAALGVDTLIVRSIETSVVHSVVLDLDKHFRYNQ